GAEGIECRFIIVPEVVPQHLDVFEVGIRPHNQSLTKRFAVGDNFSSSYIGDSITLGSKQGLSFIAHRKVHTAVVTEVETVHAVVMLITLNPGEQIGRASWRD